MLVTPLLKHPQPYQTLIKTLSYQSGNLTHRLKATLANGFCF
jgi:hypothetical protein